MTGKWRVGVDQGLCISSGLCVGTAPGRFAFGEHARSQPLAELIDPDETVRDAAAACPAEAISVTEADTGQPVDLG